MLRLLGLRGSSNDEETFTVEQKVQKVLKQAEDFEICLTAMDYVLDDRASEGLQLIEDKNEAIYKLATGVVHFIEFTLGFEQEMREKAQRTLLELESLSSKAKQFNEKYHLQTSSLYPPGTEYAVTLAESTLLHALCMLLSESMIESAKLLYKLRKAYHILDDISRQMEINLRQGSTSSLSSSVSVSTTTLNSGTTTTILNKFVDIPIPLTEQQRKDAKTVKICDKIWSMRKSRFSGSNIGNEKASTRLRTDLGLDSDLLSSTESQTSLSSTLNDVNTSTIDEFIHSGVNLCFGILQVVLSLIPPAIGKVLSIVGFKGSREAGLAMLWKAADLRNIHGSLALLALLTFYDGPFQFTDVDFDVPSVLPSKEEQAELQELQRQTSKLSLRKTLSRKKMDLESRALSGLGEPTLLYPGKRLQTLLLAARAAFPHSALWLLQEGRMLASRGRLEEAITLMDSLPGEKIQMRQVELLLVFDRAMILVFMHKYERLASDFIRLVEINAWSHALYFYMAGACYLESWRMCQTGLLPKLTGKDDIDPSKEKWYLEQLEKFLLEAPEQIGKKKFMAKMMPFERFFVRKMGEIKQVSKLNHLSTTEAIGTSLIHELSYFWNGYNRMSEEQLKLAIQLLSYSAVGDDTCLVDDSGKPYSELPRESTEQKMIRLTLQAISMRRLGQIKEGELALDWVLKNIVTADGKTIKLAHDPWLYPTLLYEKLLFVWKRLGVEGLDEVKKWLARSMAYGGDDYELSTRVSMKTKAAIDRLESL